jgi:hypothetical protein
MVYISRIRGNDNNCPYSSNWTYEHVTVPILRIIALLAPVIVILFILLKYGNKIKKWFHNHSRDVPLELEYLTLKQKINDKDFLKHRIMEFYILVAGGVVISLMFHVFASSFPTEDDLIIIAFKISFIMFCLFALIGLWLFKKKNLKILLLLRYITGVVLLWELVVFISYLVWPLYILRYAYTTSGAGLLATLFPGSQPFVEFPYYGIVWLGESYTFNFTIDCAHPMIWGAFNGIGIFIPGQSVNSKIKKTFIFFTLDHTIYALTVLVQQVLYINMLLPWEIVHLGPASASIGYVFGTIWRVITIIVLYPDTRLLIKKTIQIVKNHLKVK